MYIGIVKENHFYKTTKHIHQQMKNYFSLINDIIKNHLNKVYNNPYMSTFKT